MHCGINKGRFWLWRIGIAQCQRSTYYDKREKIIDFHSFSIRFTVYRSEHWNPLKRERMHIRETQCNLRERIAHLFSLLFFVFLPFGTFQFQFQHRLRLRLRLLWDINRFSLCYDNSKCNMSSYTHFPHPYEKLQKLLRFRHVLARSYVGRKWFKQKSMAKSESFRTKSKFLSLRCLGCK